MHCTGKGIEVRMHVGMTIQFELLFLDLGCLEGGTYVEKQKEHFFGHKSGPEMALEPRTLL